MWKRKLEAEAPEAAIFYGSGSSKLEMNGSGSYQNLPLLWNLRQDIFF